MTNKDDDKDSDYLIIRNTGLSPRTLEEFLSSRIAVNTVHDKKAMKVRIENIALAADPITKKKVRSKSIANNLKQKRRKTKTAEENSVTDRNRKVSARLNEEKKGSAEEERKSSVRISDDSPEKSLPPVHVKRVDVPEIIEVNVSSRRDEELQMEPLFQISPS